LGIEALLADRAEFPRRKACGEGLSIIGIREIERLGMLDGVLAQPHLPFAGFRFYERGGSSTIRVLDEPLFHGIGISRFHLDGTLVQRAQSLDALHVRLGGIPKITRAGDRFRIATDDTEFEAKYLVLATGGVSTLPDRLGVPSSRARRSRCGAYVAISTPSTLPAREPALVSILIGDRYEVCCTNTGGAMNLAFLTAQDHAHLLRRKNLVELVRRVQDIAGIEGEIASDPIGAAGIGAVARPPRAGRIFLVGDAVRQLDPIGGMGMTQALISARVTADTIAGELCGAGNTSVSRESHEQRVTRELRRLSAYTHLSYYSLSHALGRKTLGRLKTSFVARRVLSSMHAAPPAGQGARKQA
jgi:flavin-dependent dehydrogenase